MILPGKHISMDYSLLGIGGVLLRNLDQPQTVSSLWERTKQQDGIATFDRFVSALSILYMLGALKLEDGLLVRSGVSE